MPRTTRSVPSYCLHSPNLDFPFRIDSALYSAGSLDFAHTLFAPLHYSPGYAYPLIVWLHGRGGDERQLQRIMPLVSMQNYVAVAPQGFRPADAEPSPQGYGWLQTPDQIQRAEQRVFESIELAQLKFHVATQRVFLAGFDCRRDHGPASGDEPSRPLCGGDLAVWCVSLRRRPFQQSGCRPARGGLPGDRPGQRCSTQPLKCARTCGYSMRLVCRQLCGSIPAGTSYHRRC